MELKSLQIKQDDWLITVSSCEFGWSFYCLPPEGDPITDDTPYPNRDAAIAAAKRFVQRSQVRLKLGLWIDDLFETERISADEFEQALTWVAQLMRDR